MPEIRRKDARREDPVATIAVPREVVEEPIETRVSAILIGYNQATALRRAIEALEQSRDRERLEILVIDCGSSDESSQLDAEYAGISMLRLPHNFGATKALNIATRSAKAELVLYLSPNVEVAAETVSKLADRLEADTETSAVCPLLVDEQGTPLSTIRDLPTRDALAAVCAGQPFPGSEVDLSQESIAVEYPSIEALMVRKSFLKGMNYFDERFGHHWADADLAAQFYRAQRKVRIYPAIRTTRHDAPDPYAGDALVEADCILGAAAFLSKYHGFMAGLSFRVGAIFRAMGRFDFRLLGALVSGQKLDGSQAM
jgi:glycosyltransferase involved in cell wall biosynthesis